MRSYTFRLPGLPIGWQRAGVSFDRRAFYDKQKKQKKALSDFLSFSDSPLDGPLGCECTYAFKRPKRHTGNDYFIHAPDLDNLNKFHYDMLVFAGVIVDDRLICYSQEKKIYADDEYVDVTIFELE